MLFKFVLPLLAVVNGVSAFKTHIDHNKKMSETIRTKSGYSRKEFGKLVDSVLSACDSNGCDAGTKKCNIAHCISIDGDHFDANNKNIQKIIGKFLKASMHTKDTKLSNCYSSGCDFSPAVSYTIPSYISLRRNYDNEDPNVLYKISITNTEVKDACDVVFDMLSAVAGGFSAPDIFGPAKVAFCSK